MSKKHFRYFIFYTKTDFEIYAYTPERKIADLFRITRDFNKFYEKKVKCTSEDLKEMFELYPDSLLRMEGFDFGNLTLELPLTVGESITITNYASYQVYVKMPSLATIPPQIFNEEIRDFLEEIGYSDAFEYYVHGRDYNPKIDKFNTFLHLYSDTLNLKERGDLVETLYVLSNQCKLD